VALDLNCPSRLTVQRSETMCRSWHYGGSPFHHGSERGPWAGNRRDLSCELV